MFFKLTKPSSPPAKSWQDIPADILLLIIDIASLRQLLSASTLDIPKSSHRYISQIGYDCNTYRYIDQGVGPIAHTCRHWYHVAQCSPLRTHVLAFWIELHWHLPESTASELVDFIHKSAITHQVEIRIICPFQLVACKNVHQLLMAVAPHLRRLGLRAVGSIQHNVDIRKHYVWLDDPSVPKDSIRFPKLLDLELSAYPFPPMETMTDVPKLLRFTINQADISPLSNLLASEIFIHLLEPCPFPSYLLEGRGEILTFLEIKTFSHDVTVFEDLPTNSLSFLELRCLRILSLKDQSALTAAINAIHAPKLTSFSVTVSKDVHVSAPPPEGNMIYNQMSLTKFPSIERLSLSGTPCICNRLWMSDAVSCPHLKSLWISDHDPLKTTRCSLPDHIRFFCLDGRTCNARTIFLNLYSAVKSGGFDSVMDSLLSTVSVMRFPHLESLRIQFKFPAMELVEIANCWLAKLVHIIPSLTSFVFGSNGWDFAVYEGQPLKLVAVFIQPVVSVTIFPEERSDLGVKTVVLNIVREEAAYHPIVRLWDFTETETLVFNWKDIGLAGYVKNLVRHLGNITLSMTPPPHPVGVSSWIDALNNGIRGIIAPTTCQTKWGALNKLSFILPPSPSQFLDSRVVEALKKLLSCRGCHIKQIDSTVRLEQEQDLRWFQKRGVCWTIIPFGEETAYKVYVPNAPLSSKDCDDRQACKQP